MMQPHIFTSTTKLLPSSIPYVFYTDCHHYRSRHAQYSISVQISTISSSSFILSLLWWHIWSVLIQNSTTIITTRTTPVTVDAQQYQAQCSKIRLVVSYIKKILFKNFFSPKAPEISHMGLSRGMLLGKHSWWRVQGQNDWPRDQQLSGRRGKAFHGRKIVVLM